MAERRFEKKSEGGRKHFHIIEFLERNIRLDDTWELSLTPGEGWSYDRVSVNLSVSSDDGRQAFAIVRYDNAHGFPHRDCLYLNPPTKEEIFVGDLAEFHRRAREDIEMN